jgi:hypothetical protein
MHFVWHQKKAEANLRKHLCIRRKKYFKRLLKEGSNVVVLDRDVAKAFPDSTAVNKALRSVMKSRKPRRVSRP